nr:DEAD/DEAH box helicase [uncultured Holophaga sp.]
MQFFFPDSVFDKLQPLPEAILMAMGAIGQPAARGHLAKTLVKSKVAPQAAPWIQNPAGMSTLMEVLQEAGFAHEPRKGFWAITREAREVVCRRAHRKGCLKALASVGQAGYGTGEVVLDPLGRDLATLRVTLVEGESKDWLAAQERVRQAHGQALGQRDPLSLICGEPFDPEWFESLSPALQSHAAWALLHDQTLLGQRNEAFLEWLRMRSGSKRSPVGPVLEFLVMEGRLEEADALLDKLKPTQRALTPVALLEAALRLAQGRATEAAAGFEGVLAQLQGAKKKAIHLPGLMDTFCILAFLGRGDAAGLKEAAERLELMARRHVSDPISAFHDPLQRILLHRLGQPILRNAARSAPSGLATFAECLSDYLCEVRLAPEALEQCELQLDGLPLGLFRRETEEMARRARGGVSAVSYPFLDLVSHEEVWEKALEALQSVARPTDHRPGRLAWWVWRDPESRTPYAIEGREQRLDTKGTWSRGKAVSMKRLKEETRSWDFLLPQDHALLACIRENWKGFELDFEGALKALIGHPLVFWSEGEVEKCARVEVVAGQPQLRVTRREEVLEIRMEPPLSEEDVLVDASALGRVQIIAITPAHRKLAEILGSGLQIPAKAENQMLQALGSVAPMVTVHSEVAVSAKAAKAAGMTRLEAASGFHILLMPFHQGLKAQLRVRPVEDGEFCIPGEGGASLLMERKGKRILVNRSPEAEREGAERVREALPTLPLDEGLTEWMIDDPERCMHLLMELEAIKDQVTVHWPEGGKLNPPGSLGLNAMRLTIKRNGSWFDAEGEIRLEDGQVMDLAELLEATKDGANRMIRLSDGKFVALTEQFRRRLEDLRAMGEEQDKGLRLHSLSALALEGLEEELGEFKTDNAWQTHVEKLKDSMALEPSLPDGFQASLRSYQQEGYRWMQRLATAGLGACLADDMGLGKTVQTLSMLLARAEEGPALVLAPTSVCPNWMIEAQKFAPRLRLYRFGDGDREQLLQEAGPYDVIVCSYGLLQLEAERLQRVQWGTVVLDEGQAIKNAFTKRSQAVMELKSGFRLLLSGTPVENHLAELWNLFHFLNPGLLGTLEQFRQRFQEPVERDLSSDALARLRRIVSPFLLRRLKTEVLGELPARTEITLELEPSQEELGFLEALRRESLASLEGSEGQALQVLAALTRLRRACCNAKLVQENLEIPSAKLEAFLDLVDELRANGHRALVFSQFVDHLGLLRHALDQRGVSYQYLDGSVPARKRAAAVKAFQAGEGELFLISLKAGGTGLNLTAADYVIHMDPWWNPAVEDQASDRAHRMGQTKPVTVYRLVLKGSVEQKILALHEKKRQMAEDLLSEGALAAKLDTSALMALLREE